MPGDQARPASLLACVLLLVGCSGGVPKDIDPRQWWRNLSGAYLDGREPPPGRDAPYPNLATVPARPVPPSAAEREALTAALAADRAGSRVELTGVAGTGVVGIGAAETGVVGIGAAPLAPATSGAQPPAPPTLASVPTIWLEPEPAPIAPAMVAPPVPATPGPATPGPATPGPAGPAAQRDTPATPGPATPGPAAPAAQPSPPPLSGPPPAPMGDLLAPPPPPGADLLAPRGN